MKRMNVVGLAAAILMSPALAQAQDTWTEYPAADEAFSRHGMTAYGTSLVLFGGRDPLTDLPSTKTRIYDTVLGSWSQGADLPAARYGMGSATLGGSVYCVGGFDTDGTAVATTYLYEPASDTWTEGPALAIARGGVACVEVAGQLHAFGGTDGSVAFSDTEVLTLTAPAWVPGPAMAVARYEAFAAVVGSRVVVGGGRDDSGLPLATVVVLDPVRRTWSAAAAMPVAVADGAVGALNDRLFCVGGTLIGGPLGPTLEYSPNLDAWTYRAGAPAILDGGRAAGVGTLLFALGSTTTPGDANRLFAYEAPAYGAAPAAPSSLFQATVSGTILVEGSIFPGNVVVAGAELSESESDLVRVDIEVRPADEPFSNWPTHSGEMGAAGAKSLEVPVGALGQYRWQVRAVDEDGNSSGWVQFGEPSLYDFETSVLVDSTGATDGIDGISPIPGTVPAENLGGSSGGSKGGCGGSATGGQGAAGAAMALLLAAGSLRARK